MLLYAREVDEAGMASKSNGAWRGTVQIHVFIIRDMAWARYWCNDMRRVHRWLHVVSVLWLSATSSKGRLWI